MSNTKFILLLFGTLVIGATYAAAFGVGRLAAKSDSQPAGGPDAPAGGFNTGTNASQSVAALPDNVRAALAERFGGQIPDDFELPVGGSGFQRSQVAAGAEGSRSSNGQPSPDDAQGPGELGVSRARPGSGTEADDDAPDGTFGIRRDHAGDPASGSQLPDDSGPLAEADGNARFPEGRGGFEPGGGQFRAAGFGLAGGLSGVVTSVGKGAITLETPFGPVTVELGESPLVLEATASTLDLVRAGARISLVPERSEDGGLRAATITVLPPE